MADSKGKIFTKKGVEKALLKIDEILMEELDDVSGLSHAIQRIRLEVFGA